MREDLGVVVLGDCLTGEGPLAGTLTQDLEDPEDVRRIGVLSPGVRDGEGE